MESNIVKDYMSGNTRIKVADDYYRDKTPEEVDKILKSVSEIIFRAAISKEANKNNRRYENADKKSPQLGTGTEDRKRDWQISNK